MLSWKTPTHITPIHFLFIKKKKKKTEGFILEQLINVVLLYLMPLPTIHIYLYGNFHN